MTAPCTRRITVTLALLIAHVATGVAVAGDCDVTPHPSWKNEVTYLTDPFRNNNSFFNHDSTWIKFAILTCDPDTVYFQNSNQYDFHYEFATQFLDPFVGMSLEEFNDVTLFEANQQAILGAVIFPPTATINFNPTPVAFEYGIQFIRNDPYTAQEIVDLFHTVESAVIAEPNVQALYFPTFEQAAVAAENEAFFLKNGIEVSSAARWSEGNVCYSQGWNLGRLNFVPAGDVEDAYLAGDLLPTDILLTDGIPTSLPFLAGIVSLVPATPNSHVAILADGFDIPFVFLAQQEDADAAEALLGRRVVLRGFGETNNCDVRVIDVEDQLTEDQISQILELREPPKLDIDPMESPGPLTTNTTPLNPSDIRFYGGKAANFGVLRRSIPNSSPVAMAVSFDLWNGFLDQALDSGQTLRQYIANKLAPFQTYPPSDFNALANALDDIRDIFKDEDETQFPAALRVQLLADLQDPQYGFDPSKKIRFRSSSNVEDSEHFTGAGLYDSNSGCLADNLDGDATGPSICDADDANEKGVFHSIRRVFASFYNDNAYLERLRHSVNEGEVGMGLLVHHSFPDEIELANGVATITRDPFGTEIVRLVTQKDAVSVTNPEQDGSIPEEVIVRVDPFAGLVFTLQTQSNLVILGDHILEWTAEYEQLYDLLQLAKAEYINTTGAQAPTLDFEYKKTAPGGGALPAGGLVVKQIRPLPTPGTNPTITPFLINEPTAYFDPHSIFSYQGAKQRWTIETRNMWLEPPAIDDESIIENITIEGATDGCDLSVFSGPPTDLPEYAYHYEPQNFHASHIWQLDDLDNPRTFIVEISNLGRLVSESESPILTIRDLGAFGALNGVVNYDEPVASIPGSDFTTSIISNAMTVDRGILPTYNLYGGVFEQDGVTVDTLVYLAPQEGDICAGCHNIFGGADETTITGLTSQPIVLTGDFSQGYAAGNHNFFQTFAFDPFLDPGVPNTLLAELAAQDIRIITVEIVLIIGEDISINFYSESDLDIRCAGCGFLSGDADCDGDIDLADFAQYNQCATGPDVSIEEPICHLFDFDDDNDVDFHDAGLMLRVFTGP